MAFNNHAQEIQETNRLVMKAELNDAYISWAMALDSYHKFHMAEDPSLNVFEEDLVDSMSDITDVLEKCAGEALDPQCFKLVQPYLSAIVKANKDMKKYDVSDSVESELEKLSSTVVSMYQCAMPPAPKTSGKEPQLHPLLGGKRQEPYIH